MTDHRTRLSLEARRTELLEVGLRLFSTTPYDAVSAEGIAQAAGISKGLLYHYFAGKRGFYIATLQEVARRLLEVTDPDPELPPERALRHSLAGFLGFISENHLLYAALIRGGVGSDPAVAALVEAVRQTSMERVFRVFGNDDPAPLHRAAVYGWVGFGEAVGMDLVAHRDLALDEAVDLLVNVLLSLVAMGEKTR